MYQNIVLFALFSAICNVKNCNGQYSATCTEINPCVLLKDCPAMLQKAKSGVRGNKDNLLFVKRNICGFRGSNSKVCCKKDLVTPSGEDLLPRDCGQPDVIDRIKGGKEAPRGAYPWMVGLEYEKMKASRLPEPKFACGASLINKRYVLTAAHCLDKKLLGSRKLKWLHLGEHDLRTSRDCIDTYVGPDCSPEHIVVGVEEQILHPDYNSRAWFSDDVGLIRMDRDVTFRTEIKPVCLPPINFDVKEFIGNRKLVGAGWGFTGDSFGSDILKSVTLPLRNPQKCKNLFSQFIGNQLCVGGVKGQDTCTGDSGGPLVLSTRFGPPIYQLGIVSFGAVPCDINKLPGVYVNVNDYRNWIVQNLRP